MKQGFKEIKAAFLYSSNKVSGKNGDKGREKYVELLTGSNQNGYTQELVHQRDSAWLVLIR